HLANFGPTAAGRQLWDCGSLLPLWKRSVGAVFFIGNIAAVADSPSENLFPQAVEITCQGHPAIVLFSPSMKILKFAAVSLLVFGTIAANDVAPSNSELEAMYDKAYRAFDAANYTETLKQLDAIDARKPDLAASQNLRGVVYMRQ